MRGVIRTKREAASDSGRYRWKRSRLMDLAAEPGQSLWRRALFNDAWRHWLEADRSRTLPD